MLTRKRPITCPQILKDVVHAVVRASLLIGFASAVQAQQPPDADSAAVSTGASQSDTLPVAGKPTEAVARAPQNRQVEEIVVTAQKREENLQDVPIAVSAFSAATLDAKGITESKDLSKATPGLTYNEAVSFSIIYLRGIGTDAFILADPSVATYVDGIYFPFGAGQSQNFGAIERLEVLKGPQGTLFGRNTTGGAISITTKSPGPEKELSINTSYGSFNDLKTRVYASTPIAYGLSVSVSGIYDHGGLYYKFEPDSVQKGPAYTDKGFGGRIKIRWKPQDWFDLILTYQNFYQQGGKTLIAPNTAPSPLAQAIGIKAQPRNFTAELSDPVGFTNRNNVYYGQATTKTDWFDIKFLGAYEHIRNEGHLDFDGSNFPGVDVISPLFSNVKTAELQVLSNDTSWGHRWMQYIAGLYYITSKQGLTPTLSLLDSATGSTLGIPVDDLLKLIPTQVTALFPGLPISDGVNIHLSGELGTRSPSAFFQDTFFVTDWASLIVGGRYQIESREVVHALSGVTNVSGGQTVLLDFGHPSAKTHNFSPKGSLNFRPFDDVLLYYTWQQGFKGGTYNIIDIYTPPAYVKPEEVTANEIGIKSEFFNKNLRFNAAVFHDHIRDFQVQFISLLNGGAVSFENAAAARIQGFDFDALAVLFPNTIDNLVLTVSGAYLNGKYLDYTNGSGFNPSTGLYESGQDFTGNRTVRTPKYSTTVSLAKTFAIPGGPLEATVDTYYNSGYYYLAQNTKTFSEGEYYVLGSHLSYLYEPWNLRTTVFGDNLNNRKYAYSQFDDDFGRLESLAPPRSFGVRLNWDFMGS